MLFFVSRHLHAQVYPGRFDTCYLVRGRLPFRLEERLRQPSYSAQYRRCCLIPLYHAAELSRPAQEQEQKLAKTRHQAARSAAPVQLKTLRMSPGLHPVLSVAHQVLGSARAAAHSVATSCSLDLDDRKEPSTARSVDRAATSTGSTARRLALSPDWPTSIAAEAPATAAQTWAAALLGTGWRPGDIRRALVPRIQSWAKRSGSEPPRL